MSLFAIVAKTSSSFVFAIAISTFSLFIAYPLPSIIDHNQVLKDYLGHTSDDATLTK